MITMQNYSLSKQAISSGLRDKIELCRTFCQETPNFPHSVKFCGVDDCLTSASKDGIVNSWCCKMAEYWDVGNKDGVIKNPLASIKSKCGIENPNKLEFMNCVDVYRVNGTLSDECCAKLPAIKKFDNALGIKAENTCSMKRAAAVCKAQYMKDYKYSDACCSYLQANNGKIKNTQFFAGDNSLANILDSAKSNCDAPDKKDIPEVAKCLDNFHQNGNINNACCTAFYNGTLIPSAVGINYNLLDHACFPEKY